MQVNICEVWSEGMKLFESNNSIVIQDCPDFNSTHIFECGQCFRWNKIDPCSFIGVVGHNVLKVIQRDNEIEIVNINKKEFDSFVIDYFDLSRNYSKIKDTLKSDEVLKTAIEFGYGIRILKQDLWECIMSFITSANNRIPMIKRTVDKLSQSFGDELEFEGKKYYSFPTPEQLKNCTIEDYNSCGTGFRAKYLKNAVTMVLNGELELDKLKDMDTLSASTELQKIPGIGPKVSDCILLFALQRHEVFPTDVWVKRVMEYFYSKNEKLKLCQIQNLAKNLYGDLAGFAQQYLFYYAREMKIGKDPHPQPLSRIR